MCVLYFMQSYINPDSVIKHGVIPARSDIQGRCRHIQDCGMLSESPHPPVCPALYKLIDAGYISDHKEQVGKRMIRIYYHLEDSGKTRLDLLLHDYYQTNQAIQDILRFNGDEHYLK